MRIWIQKWSGETATQYEMCEFVGEKLLVETKKLEIKQQEVEKYTFNFEDVEVKVTGVYGLVIKVIAFIFGSRSIFSVKFTWQLDFLVLTLDLNGCPKDEV